MRKTIRVTNYLKFWQEHCLRLNENYCFIGTYDDNFNDNTMYVVSNKGRIFSNQLNRDITPKEGNDCITFYINGIHYVMRVHRLVAVCFLEERGLLAGDGNVVVHHIDLNHYNNNVNNLRLMPLKAHSALHRGLKCNCQMKTE